MLLDGDGEGDEVAPAVGDVDVGGLRVAVHQLDRRERGRDPGDGAGRHGAGVLGQVDQGGALLDVLGGEPAGEGDVDELGVAEVGVAIGEREVHRLHHQVVAQAGVERVLADVEPLEDVEELQHGEPAGAGRRGGDDLVVAVLALHRVVDGDLIMIEVGHLHAAAGGLDLGDEGLADRPVVEGVDAVVGEEPQGVGELGLDQQLADRQRFAAGQEQGAGGRVGGQHCLVFDEAGGHEPADDHAVVGQRDRGRDQVGERAGAELGSRVLGRGQSTRDADGDAESAPLGERDRLAVFLEKHLRLGAGGGALAAVDDRDRVVVGVVDHHEAAAADAGEAGLGDAERELDGDRGVDRVAAFGEDLRADPRGLVARRDDHAVLAADDRADRSRDLRGRGVGGGQHESGGHH
ncbi:hypothetical protein OV090_42470 [Nannocystis sp. RBIL2]|uniref:hypothetical protein n=1 Tax=Nannocystis sp. RBIL2 TaxID=2996788 RepID=UPI0022721F62|nr:hypothetical protein [Nannocystis sp. RBIL2]MCY1071484.1 hypothetical protein [Nannocystis sp. RBIL2]